MIVILLALSLTPAQLWSAYKHAASQRTKLRGHYARKVRDGQRQTTRAATEDESVAPEASFDRYQEAMQEAHQPSSFNSTASRAATGPTRGEKTASDASSILASNGDEDALRCASLLA